MARQRKIEEGEDMLIKFFVCFAWLIPGSPHRWAKSLIAERKAMLAACEKYLRDIENELTKKRTL